MIIRVYIACLLSFACAEDITDVRSVDDIGGSPTYRLEAVEVTMGNSTAATLKDVQFISKISETVSLLVTNKNVTWKYDEAANTMETISFDEAKKKSEYNSLFKPLDESEFGFSKQLLRFYKKKDETEAQLVTNYDKIIEDGNSFSVTVPVGANIFDKGNPPVILYLNADMEEDWATPSVLIYTKGGFALLSDKMTCEDKGAEPVNISGAGGSPVIKGASGGLVGGIGSDGKSFWASTSKQFVLYRQHGCKLVDKGGGKVSNHDYKSFSLDDEEPLFKVSYEGNDAFDLPLGVWIDVSGDDDPVVKGNILSISKEGKLLIAE